jgi:hypothetical protein
LTFQGRVIGGPHFFLQYCVGTQLCCEVGTGVRSSSSKALRRLLIQHIAKKKILMPRVSTEHRRDYVHSSHDASRCGGVGRPSGRHRTRSASDAQELSSRARPHMGSNDSQQNDRHIFFRCSVGACCQSNGLLLTRSFMICITLYRQGSAFNQLTSSRTLLKPRTIPRALVVGYCIRRSQRLAQSKTLFAYGLAPKCTHNCRPLRSWASPEHTP